MAKPCIPQGRAPHISGDLGAVLLDLCRIFCAGNAQGRAFGAGQCAGQLGALGLRRFWGP